MRTSRLLAALLLVLVGLVWIGQGIGLIGGSFMSNDSAWAVVGAGLLITGVAVAVRERSATARS